jgi:hypothetical protein
VTQDLKLAGAAINALAETGDPAAVEALWRLQSQIKHRALRKQLDTALQTAAGRQGITPAQLVERTVPSHGLAPDGSAERTLGEHTARVAVQDAATVRLTFAGADGRASRTAPAAVKDGFPDELKALKALAKEVRGTLSSERARIEGLLSQDQTWPYGEWCEHYRDHPITGAVVRGLIWEFQDEHGDWRAALADSADKAVQVRLWHPIRAAAGDVRAWRERIADERIRQPFKQAFREIYLLTPAEEETGTYSNRFAAHLVHYRRMFALFRARGWTSRMLGPWDGGGADEAARILAAGEWRVRFSHVLADWEHEQEIAGTNRVLFDRRVDGSWRNAPLTDVPPLVFSEAMRDVDLFVGVTSIAADPMWEDGEAHEYWVREWHADLNESTQTRKDALARILPRTKIAGRCSIDDRHLVVRGRLRTYKIHLGSANIVMEPDDAFLCIVPERRALGAKVFLPFEDERLSLILSKAFLLADDARITDPSILRQLGR